MVSHSGDLYTGMGMQTYHLGTLQKGYNPNCVPFGSYAHFQPGKGSEIH